MPSNTARHVVSQILAHGRVRRGYLGIGGRQRPLSRRMARYFGLSRESGVEVVTLDPNGPAGGSGIRKGDIVIGMNGHPVESVDDLHRMLAEVGIGEPARIDVLRGTERMSIEVPIAEEAA